MNRKKSVLFAAVVRAATVAAVITVAAFGCCSCSPTLSVRADGAEGVHLSFLTGFSDSTARLLRSMLAMTGAVDESVDKPLFSADDLRAVLESSGFTKIEAKNVSSTTINASALYQNLRLGELSKMGILSRTANSLTLTLGPRQLWTLYALSNEETQLYLDLLMLPALSGETLSVSEYNALLASLYGPSFAGEITGGTLTLTLSAPDGKKSTTTKLTLGELLTLAEERSWTITW